MTHKLTNVLLAVTILLVVAMLAAVIGITWFLWHEKATVESAMRNTGAMIREVTETAKNLREASDTWKKASADQSSAILSATQDVSVAAKRLSGLSSALEKSSTALLNELTDDARAQSTQLLLNQKQLQVNLVDLQGATGELRLTLQTADRQIGNPAIAETFEHIDAASYNAAQGLGEASKAVTDVREMADHAKEVYLKPAKLWWTLIEKVLGLGPPIATAVK